MQSTPTRKHEKYTKIRTVGKGTFGLAYLVKAQSTAQLHVLKEIDIRQMTTEEKTDALKEAKLLEVLNHPNIIKFQEVYKTKTGKLCIVMEYAENGDLQKEVESRRKRLKEGDTTAYFQEDEILDIVAQVCRAIQHIHELQILHRDIKLGNIFLKSNGQIKLGDFGIAKVLNTQSKAKSIVGSPYYLSPEILKAVPYKYEADVWAIGVLTYILCSLYPPFTASDNSFGHLIQRILSGKYEAIPGQFSDHLKLIIKGMLKQKPHKRPTIGQIVKHPLIKVRIDAQAKSFPALQDIALQNQQQQEADNMESQGSEDRDDADGDPADPALATAGDSSSMNDTKYSKQSYLTTESECDGLKPEDQELINLYGKEADFVKKMAEEFGEELFTEAYKTIDANQSDVYDDTTGQVLRSKLAHLPFKDEAQLSALQDRVTTYLILRNMQM